MYLFLDFESFYSEKEGYSLKKMSMVEYIRSPKFKAFGAGVAIDGSQIQWIPAHNLQDYFDCFEWDIIDLIGHNVKFDGSILAWKYGKIPRSFIDTKGMSRAVLGKVIKNHSLATLAEHFKLTSKGHLATDGKFSLTVEEENALAEYCIHDVNLCREIYSQLAKDFPQNQYPILDQTIRMFVNPKLQLNVPLLEKSAIEEAKRRADIFKEIGIDKSEFASNVKFPELLRKEGYEVPMKESPRKKDEMGNSVKIPALALGDTDFLEMWEEGDERLKMLCEARVAAKSTLLETRSKKLAAIGHTGKWPFDVEFSGADQTHRFSGGSGAGGNPQNFGRCQDAEEHRLTGHICRAELRNSVEVPERYELVVGDFSNIELRIVAYLSRDSGLIEAIEKGKDIYCDFASAFYGRTISKENKKERQFGKTAILGLGYGMGWKKFIKTVRTQTGETITDEISKKAVELYRTRYAGVPALWQKLDATICNLQKANGLTTLLNIPVRFIHEAFIMPSGLKVRFPNIRQELGERGNMEWAYDVYVKGHLEKRKLYGGKLLENISQGLAGELCKESMLEMGENIVGQCHDELHIICKKGLGQVTAAKLKRAMTKAPSWLPNMVLGAEVKVGSNWGNCK